LEAWTKTANLPNYDADSNQWHKSIVVAQDDLSYERPPPHSLLAKRRVRPSLKISAAGIQVSYSDNQIPSRIAISLLNPRSLHREIGTKSN